MNAITPDIMHIQIGNIPAEEKITIEFSIIEPLDIVLNKYWSFRLLSTLSEKYGSYKIANPSEIARY